MRQRVLVTGGAGFIGCNLIRLLLRSEPELEVVNLDKLTYAGHPANLADVAGSPRYRFVRGDICDAELVDSLFAEAPPAAVFHLAAESHVDRSIAGPEPFVQTNVVGTLSLLRAACQHWLGRSPEARFIHVSTDEVYGSLTRGRFREEDPYRPSSPYSASKAAADHLVRAFQRTHGLPAVITHGCNNYGPYQYPEKLIPVVVSRALRGEAVPVYGSGGNVREWIHVEDHCRGLALAWRRGRVGESYNLGSGEEAANLDLVRLIVAHLEARLGRRLAHLITFVPDRAGHDWRYALESAKARRELGFRCRHRLGEGLRATVDWYLDHLGWVATVSGQAPPEETPEIGWRAQKEEAHRLAAAQRPG